MGITYNPRIVTDGLVLALDAANTKSYPQSGTTWTDLSGNGNTGTLTNGPTYSSANGGSIAFDGGNDWVNLGNPSNLNILNFTICAWSKSFTFTNYQNLIFKGDTAAGQYGIIVNSSGQWTVQPNIGFISGDSLTLNTWNFLVGTCNGTQITAYRNGQQKAQYSISPISRGSVVSIGADIPNSRYFNGNIAHVSMYNRALSAAEISQNFNALRSRFSI
jgi:hypothetical protein